MDTIVAHTGAVVALIIFAQVLICAVPSFFYLRFSKGKRPLVLGALLGGVHVLVLTIVALASGNIKASPDAGLAWIAICVLDMPATYWFKFAESLVPVQGYFALAGTAQYFAVGVVIGGAYRLGRGRRVSGFGFRVSGFGFKRPAVIDRDVNDQNDGKDKRDPETNAGLANPRVTEGLFLVEEFSLTRCPLA